VDVENKRASQQVTKTSVVSPAIPILRRRKDPPIDAYDRRELERMLLVTFEPSSLIVRSNEIQNPREIFVRNMRNIGCIVMVWRQHNFQVQTEDKYFFLPRMGTVRIRIKLVETANIDLKKIYLRLLPYDFFDNGPANTPTMSEMIEAWEIRTFRREDFPVFKFPINVVAPTRASA